MAPGRPDETRIRLAASHLIDSKTSRNAALAFILADRSLIYVRKLLGPVLLDKSLKISASEPNSLFPHALALLASEWRDIGKLCLDLGHTSQAMLHRHYHRAMKRDEARAIFDVLPPGLLIVIL